jgi:hypothetical protein
MSLVVVLLDGTWKHGKTIDMNFLKPDLSPKTKGNSSVMTISAKASLKPS